MYSLCACTCLVVDELPTTSVILPPASINTTTQTTEMREYDPESNNTMDNINTTITASPTGATSTNDDVVVVERNVATEATLGVVAALLLLILVVVIMGWVWTCHWNKHNNSPPSHQHE